MFQITFKCFNNFNISNRYHLQSTYWVPSTLYAFISIYVSGTQHMLLSDIFSQQFYNSLMWQAVPPLSPFPSYGPHFTCKEPEVQRRRKDVNKVTLSVQGIQHSLPIQFGYSLCHIQTKMLVFSYPLNFSSSHPTLAASLKISFQ